MNWQKVNWGLAGLGAVTVAAAVPFVVFLVAVGVSEEPLSRSAQDRTQAVQTAAARTAAQSVTRLPADRARKTGS